MIVTIAKNAGFCFGVKRATDEIECKIVENKGNERIYTLGTLIHNETYNKSLRDRGVCVTDVQGAIELAKTASATSPVTVFIRAHGIPLADENILRKLSEDNPYFSYKDCTCPYVKKIHKIAADNSSDDNVFILTV